MRKVIIICLLLVFLFSLKAFSLEIENPQTVDYVKLQIVQYGNITFSSKPSEVWINLSIPQESSYLQIESLTANYQFQYGYDYLGNKIITIHIKDPDEVVNYKIVENLIVRRSNCDKLSDSKWTKPTELAISTDPLIKEKAEQLTLGISDDFSKIYELAKWTHENIEYSESYKDVNLNARDVFLNKKGTCDEYSILLLSFARALGYPSAIISGYAYGSINKGGLQDFQPHSWVQIGDTGCWDPTWAEGGFIDALHIPFGKYEDTRWVDVAVSFKAKENITAKISPMNVEIKILDYKKSSITSLESELLENSLNKGFAVIKNKIASNSCIMTKIKSVSCAINEKSLLENIRNEGIVKVCGKEAYFFSIFKIPDNLETNKFEYTCPILTVSYTGNENKNFLEIKSGAKYENAFINVNKNTAILGENIIVSAPGQFIFTDLGDYGTNSLNILSPSHDFKIWAYKNGGLAEVNISVVKYKPLDVEIILLNNTVKLGETINFKVKITNKLSTPQNVIVEFNNIKKSKTIDNLDYFDFNFTPSSIEDRIIQIKVSTSNYVTTSVNSINVIEEKNWLKEIIDAIIAFFKKIFG
ncbi:MAG: transglutaminase-like domain-containing protein [Candidatus Aenigmarchaeota archaeon]|nr:transglutaminase-like domain-containing protein [Candidatus Aenigmarchaeota archaeon]